VQSLEIDLISGLIPQFFDFLSVSHLPDAQAQVDRALLSLIIASYS